MKNTTLFPKIFLLCLTLVGAGLRFTSLGQNSLWLDEATSLEVARHSLGDILGGGIFDNHTPPFYYLLLHGWLKFFPQTEFGIRSLSASIDSLNILLCFWAFFPLLGALPSLLLASLYSLSAYSIYFAQEARMYPLLVFFCLAFQGLFLRLAFLESYRRFAASLALGCIATAGLYTHYYFAPFAATLGVLLTTLYRRDKKFLILVGTAGTLATLCFLPWVPKVIGLANSEGQTFRQFLFLVLPYTAFRFVAGYGNLPIELAMKLDMKHTVLSNLPLLLTYIFVPLLLVLSVLKRGLEEYRERFLLLLLLLFVPPLLMLLLSLRSPMFSERYLIIVFPHFLALLALAIDPFQEFPRLNWKAKSLKLLRTTFLGLFLFSLYQHYGNPRFGFANWRGAAAEIQLQGKQEVEAVIVRPEYTRGVLQFYLKNFLPLIPFPESKEEFQKTFGSRELFEDGKFLFLIETASQESRVPWFQELGYSATNEKVFPFENGIRLTKLSLPLSTPPAQPSPPSQGTQ